jgi:hypothetical protein
LNCRGSWQESVNTVINMAVKRRVLIFISTTLAPFGSVLGFKYFRMTLQGFLFRFRGD